MPEVSLNELTLILNMAIVLAAALLAGWVFRVLLKQSGITGYLLAGIVIGPHALGIIQQTNEIRVLATIGVVLLFFTLGVKFSFSEITRMGKVSTWGSMFQIGATALLGTGITLILGFPILESIAFGLMVSQSSTMLAIAMLGERGELDSVHGRVTTGIQLMQDIAAAFIMFILPALGGTDDALALPLVYATLKAVAFVAGVFFLGRWVVPRFISKMAGRGSRELFIIGSVVLAFASAYGAFYFGLSAALGAFVVGLLISESDFAHQILGDMAATRDIFAAIFFVSIGMLLDIPLVMQNLQTVLIIIATIMAGKFIIGATAARLFGYQGKTVLLVGVGLFNIGETSFVLADLGLTAGAITLTMYNIILAVAIISIVLTPSVYNVTSRLAYNMIKNNWGRRLIDGFGVEHSPDTAQNMATRISNHVVLSGHGRVGSMVAKELDTLNIPYLVIDLDPAVIRELRNRGIPSIYGDAGNWEVLSQAGLDKAALLVITIPDPTSARLILDQVKKMKPKLDVVIRVHSQFEMKYLQGRGASELVQPEVETSIEIVRHILCRLGYSEEDVAYLIDAKRKTCPM